jgi:murein DD-endopeptidase MepM/ murein hydrolase activator NlpD
MSSMRDCGLMLAFGVALCLGGCARVGPEDRVEKEPIPVEAMHAFHPPVRTEVGAGDTIESVSRRLAGDDWRHWRDALVTELDPRRLLPGTRFEGRCTPAGELEELTVLLDRRSELHLVRVGEKIQVEMTVRPVASEVVRIEGEVVSSLFGAVEDAGARPELAVEMAQVFQWDIDFFRDVRAGDRFVAVVDYQTVDDEFFGYGTLFATRYVNDGRSYDAVVYPDDDGRLGYYDLEGRALRKQFLRSPLEFSRITSRFSMSRFHPVLKRRLPHYGVDYGAPVGTPVRVTADGTVTFLGRNGGAGRMIRVRHPNGYVTHYLHLSRYASGIRKGSRVVQGQVIGYVGSSGLSTGPHLDYRVQQNGRWINPLTISSPPTKPLDASRLQRYLAHALAILELLEGREPPVGARS